MLSIILSIWPKFLDEAEELGAVFQVVEDPWDDTIRPVDKKYWVRSVCEGKKITILPNSWLSAAEAAAHQVGFLACKKRWPDAPFEVTRLWGALYQMEMAHRAKAFELPSEELTTHLAGAHIYFDIVWPPVQALKLPYEAELAKRVEWVRRLVDASFVPSTSQEATPSSEATGRVDPSISVREGEASGHEEAASSSSTQLDGGVQEGAPASSVTVSEASEDDARNAEERQVDGT